MKVLRKLLVVSLVLAFFAIAVAQEGDQSPSFHDPFGTVVFPQFIVGPVGTGPASANLFNFDACVIVGNGGNFPFNGNCHVFGDTLNQLEGILVNGNPLPPDGIQVSLGPGGSTRLEFESMTPNPPGLLLCELLLKGNDPAGGAASVDDLSFSFFYTLRDGGGNLIDSVAVPEGRAGKGIRFVMSRRAGFDTGVAIFVTIPQPVGIRVYLPGGASPAGTTLLEGVNPLFTKFRDDFFLNEFIQNLPAVIDSAVVEIFVEIGEIYGMALGVKVEGATVQLSGQNVTPFGLEGGAPFNDQ